MLVVQLVSWRVVDLVALVSHVVLVLLAAHGAEGQVVGHAEHVDRLLMLTTVGVLLDCPGLRIRLSH